MGFWKLVCEMPEDDIVSLVLCYVGGTELHPMNIKAEEKGFSVVVSALDYKITNTNTVHTLKHVQGRW